MDDLRTDQCQKQQDFHGILKVGGGVWWIPFLLILFSTASWCHQTYSRLWDLSSQKSLATRHPNLSTAVWQPRVIVPTFCHNVSRQQASAGDTPSSTYVSLTHKSNDSLIFLSDSISRDKDASSPSISPAPAYTSYRYFENLKQTSTSTAVSTSREKGSMIYSLDISKAPQVFISIERCVLKQWGGGRLR